MTLSRLLVVLVIFASLNGCALPMIAAEAGAVLGGADVTLFGGQIGVAMAKFSPLRSLIPDTPSCPALPAP